MSLFRIFRPLRPTLTELRDAVDVLPIAVRIAMLAGVQSEQIIAGAYTDNMGGICPMLAAHRHGGRHADPDFARTWDEFAEAPIDGHHAADPQHIEALINVLRQSIERDFRKNASHPSAPTPGHDGTDTHRATVAAADAVEIARASAPA